MIAHRFDALTRSLSGPLSRRLALRRALALTLASAGLLPGDFRPARAQTPSPTPLPVCTDPARPGVGCSCTTGTQDPCGDTTLLCCAAANAAPGASGTCTPASVGCNPTGNSTSCTSHGCRCDGGTENACDKGLICCPDNPGVDGGPGHCARESHCNQIGCTGEGCFCHSGTRDGCDPGLVCCAHDSSMPGGPGRCESETVCFAQQCQATTNPCPSTCQEGSFCKECCSGYCGADGHCGTARCEGIGCICRGGVDSDCSPGLVCCQSQMTAPNQPGGPGMCAAPEGCGTSGDAGAAKATPVG